MPVDMKETIAAAAYKLVVEKKVKKLTVKDIVEECHITRQAFYYHFADIPELLRWVLEKESKQIMEEMRTQPDVEQRLRLFFQISLQAAPYVRRSMQGSYAQELERILYRTIYRCFEQAVDDDNLYAHYSRAEVRLILRYHTAAVIGLLQNWTEEDTRNIDQIVHLVYRMMLGQISPHS